MRKIKVSKLWDNTDSYEANEYESDIHRIVEILHFKGFSATFSQALDLWQNYSEHLEAMWMILPDNDDTVFACIKPYFTEE